MAVFTVKHGHQVQLSRKTDLIRIRLNVNLSNVSAEPSVIFLNTGKFQLSVPQFGGEKKQKNPPKKQKQHVLIHPLGTAHVQNPDPPILPEASPISFSSVQCCSLRHISSVRRRGEAGRQRLWRTSPTGSDGRAERQSI